MTTATVTTTTTSQRSSRRLRGLPAELQLATDAAAAAAAAADDEPVPDETMMDDMVETQPLKKARRSSPCTAKTTVESKTKQGKDNNTLSPSSLVKNYSVVDCLPRTREKALFLTSRRDVSSSASSPSIRYVLGVDEAGRGPLAGPVVAAAVWLPSDIVGIIDSKKITAESSREALYEEIMLSADANHDIRWAVAVVDAQCIDEINILQATLLGMRMALQALTDCPEADQLVKADKVSVTIPGTYVVTNQSSNDGNKRPPLPPDACYALIDGNRLPTDLPCRGETIVKGDGKEYAIAAASILAKVTRDRLMHGYDALYPEYGLAQHKGYPTAAHMRAVHTHGASPIHRRTFAPLKRLEFDTNGKIVGEKEKVPVNKPNKTTTRRRKMKDLPEN